MPGRDRGSAATCRSLQLGAAAWAAQANVRIVSIWRLVDAVGVEEFAY